MAQGRNFLEVDIVRQHFAEATRVFGQFAEAEYSELMTHELGDSEYTPPLESPLEALFFLWWGVIADYKSHWGRRFELSPQADVEACGERYRLDFVVNLEPEAAWEWHQCGREWPKLAVEVDGHSYHEKTREQVAYRNQRDRHLQMAGWTVFHFSWSEMTTRPLECVGEVLGAARQNFSRALSEEYRRPSAPKAADDSGGDQAQV